jgi:uncharacterized membrane protein YfcA
MYQYIIETILGLLVGILFGITGILNTPIILFVLDFLQIGDYKTNIGSLLFLSMFPTTIGSFYEYYKAKKIDYLLGLILLVTIILGGYIGSKFVVNSKHTLSTKTIKYLTSGISFIMSILFLHAGYTDNGKN